VRNLVSRKLSAAGFLVGEKLRVLGVEATSIKNQLGTKLLLISNVPHGPSWPQIHKALEQLDQEPTLVTLGKQRAVLVQDSELARQIVGSLAKSAKYARSRQVFLEDVGFVELESRPKPNWRLFLFPLASLVLVLTVGALGVPNEQPKGQDKILKVVTSCIVDSSTSEFNQWLSRSLESEVSLIAGQEIDIEGEIADLKIVVDNVIGSAAKVSGTAKCSDGRKLKINHRVDTSGTGDVLELGK
jgi:hypothetical protein